MSVSALSLHEVAAAYRTPSAQRPADLLHRSMTTRDTVDLGPQQPDDAQAPEEALATEAARGLYGAPAVRVGAFVNLRA